VYPGHRALLRHGYASEEGPLGQPREHGCCWQSPYIARAHRRDLGNRAIASFHHKESTKGVKNFSYALAGNSRLRSGGRLKTGPPQKEDALVPSYSNASKMACSFQARSASASRDEPAFPMHCGDRQSSGRQGPRRAVVRMSPICSDEGSRFCVTVSSGRGSGLCCATAAEAHPPACG
jgi:hypothetical protein